MTPPIDECETCWQKLEPRQQTVQCSGCGKWIHEYCQEQLDIGMRFHAMMCLMCTNKASHWLRIARAAESKTFRTWREDKWLRTVIDSVRYGFVLVETGNLTLNELQNFLATT